MEIPIVVAAGLKVVLDERLSTAPPFQSKESVAPVARVIAAGNGTGEVGTVAVMFRAVPSTKLKLPAAPTASAATEVATLLLGLGKLTAPLHTSVPPFTVVPFV